MSRTSFGPLPRIYMYNSGKSIAIQKMSDKTLLRLYRKEKGLLLVQRIGDESWDGSYISRTVRSLKLEIIYRELTI